MDPKKASREDVDWIQLAQDRFQQWTLVTW